MNSLLLQGALPSALTLAIVAAGLDAAMAQTRGERSIWTQDTLTGDWGGARTALANAGVGIGATYIGETFNVLSGGVRQGTAFEGLFDLTVDMDLQRLVGWTGGKSQARAFEIHDGGRNATDLVGSHADPSSIDALPTARLFTAWFQQDFGTTASLRIGLLAADDEFLLSPTASGLINGTFGWSTMMSENLPGTGPNYPLATPGVRLQFNPTDSVSILGAVFSGNPAEAHCEGDPQACNRYGTTFSVTGGAFVIGELQYQINQSKDAHGLAAAYKIGAWYQNGSFADQHFGVDAAGGVVTLASTPAPSPLYHSGDWGIYGVIDQMLWRSEGRNASVFARGGFSPSDRNLVSGYIDGGLGLKGFVSDRPNDVLTFGFAYSSISGDAAAVDEDTIGLSGTPLPVRSAEAIFEVSYIAQLAPWWTVQPDVQYIVCPGGNVADPNDPTHPIGDAFVIGTRTTISF